MEKYVVRADRAGVFFGEIEKQEPLGDKFMVTMNNVRKLWYWDGAASTFQLAQDGVTSPDNCQFTMYVPNMIIVGAIEIIPCTDKAIESLESVKVWKR